MADTVAPPSLSEAATFAAAAVGLLEHVQRRRIRREHVRPTLHAIRCLIARADELVERAQMS